MFETRHIRSTAELARRHNDGLEMFRAMETQLPLFESQATEVLCLGGNRCLAEGTLVATPSGPTPIESILAGDLVYNEFGNPIRVIDTFDNGPRACVRVTNRQILLAECTDDHVFLAKRHCRDTYLRPASWMRGKDRAIRRVVVECPLGPVHEPHAYSIGVLLGDGCSRSRSRGICVSSGSDHIPDALAAELGGEARRLHKSNYTYSVGVVERNNYDEWCRGRYAHEKTVDMDVIRSWNRGSLLAFVAGVLDTDGSVYVNEYENICVACEMQAKLVIEVLRYAFLALWQTPTTLFVSNREKSVNGPTYGIRVGSNTRTKRMLRELDRFLNCESKKWKAEYEEKTSKRSSAEWYGASASEDRRVVNTYDIHVASPTNLYLLANGVVTHNSGKSTAAAVKFAAVARDKPVYGPDGEPIEQRLSHQKNRPLLMWVIGLSWEHVGSTIWRLLFKPGLYKIIRDRADGTGPWRAFDPVKDAGREMECRGSFPLIPISEVKCGLKGVGWENAKERQFSHMELLNGTVIKAYASTGEVKQGDPVDYIWPDERIAIPGHYAEWQARLSDTKGRIVWSTMPREDNGAMMLVSRRAAEQREEVDNGDRDKADVEELRLVFSDNPYIDDDEKRKRLEGWSDEDRRRRDLGEYVTDSILIYPQFNRSLHRAIYELPEQDDPISKILRERNGEPPEDWTRELILDPGTAKPGVLFCAIPPPSLWVAGDPYYIPYDEIYERRIDARQLAARVKVKMGDYLFERFIVDGQAARQKPMGFSSTIGQNYTAAFAEAGLTCRMTGSIFIPGDPEFTTRKLLVDKSLSVRISGRPQLRIVTERCPNLVAQLERNIRKSRKDPEGFTIVEEKPLEGQFDDIRACFDSETEVLTDNGWKHFTDVKMCDRLATSNLATNRLEYQHPTSLIAKDFSGEILHFSGRNIDAKVTPDHRMVVYPRFEDDSPVIRMAGDLRQHDRLKMHAGVWDEGHDYDIHFIPKPARSRNGEIDVDAGDFAEFLGWYITEGCSDSNPKCPGNGFRVNISQTKKRYLPVLEPLLESLPWKWTRHSLGYSCSSKQLWSHLSPLGNVYSKRVPAWIKRSSPRLMRRFLAGYLMGDGFLDHGSFGLADDIQELFIKLGVSASLKAMPPKPWNIKGRSGMSRSGCCVSELTEPRAGLYRHDGSKPNYGAEHYAGKVHCASVPNGTLVVRRNGSPLVAGNCLEYWLSRRPKWVEVPQVERLSDFEKSLNRLKVYFKNEEPADNTIRCGPGAAA